MSSKFIGRKVNVGIGKESVRGTAVVSDFFLPHVELTLDEKITQAIDESTVGVIEDTVDAKITERRMEASLRGIIQDQSFGLILLSTLGQVASSVDDPEAGVNTHTFSVLQTAQHPSLTIVEKSPDVDKAYPLAMIETLALTIELNQFIMFTAGFRSKKGESASSTAVFTEENKFIPQHAVFKVATDLAGLDAAAAVKLRTLNLTITKNLEDDRNFGDVDPTDILNKQMIIEGSIELLFEDSTFEDLVTGDTKQAMRIELTNTDVTIGSSSNPKITFDFAKVKFSEIARNMASNDLVAQTLTFKGFYSLADAKSIEIVLINTQTSY